MQARLSALAGPLKGSVFSLEEETFIGRGSSVQIRIADSSISRKHCLIKKERDTFCITDLKSRNGTFVNGIPVRERELDHGSQIEIGESLFIYLRDEPVSASAFRVVDNSTDASTTELLHQMKDLQSKNLYLTAELSAKQNLVGQSKEMQTVYEMIRKVAPTDATVLLTGESGTGKEMIARAIHRNSRRSLNPFIAINCAAIPEALLESELFGHEKGAFTGAAGLKKGRFEMASSGTLFLDEIAELQPSLQAKLLRVLQERELERLGSQRSIPIDVRVIAATNRDLREEIEKAKFRTDLYYRLNVFVIHSPPLRNRKEDIPSLANYFFSQMAARLNPGVSTISSEAMRFLVSYDWPGNVRELRNAIERALILASGTTIGPHDLPYGSSLQTDSEPLKGALEQTVGRAKKEAIVHALKKTGGNFTKAAQLLGLQRTYLHRLVRKMKLEWRRDKS